MEQKSRRGGGSPAAGAAAPRGWVSFRTPGAWRRRPGRSPRQRERGAGAGACGESGTRRPCGTRRSLRGGSSPAGGQGKGGRKLTDIPLGLPHGRGHPPAWSRAAVCGCGEDRPGCPPMCWLRTLSTRSSHGIQLREMGIG